MFGAFRTNDISFVGDEATSDQRCLAGGANEAIIVPMTVFKRNESRATDAGDWFRARCAPLGKQFAKAIGAVWFFVATGETLTGQRSRTIGASEAFTMPWLILVGYAARCNDLVTLDASGGIFLLVAAGAIDILFARNERFRSDRCFAYATREAFLMPLSGFVFHFLCASTEHFAATVAARRELGIVAIAAVDLLGLGAELFVH